MENDDSSQMHLNSSSILDVHHLCEVPESSTNLRSVTTVLHYCKSKILNPYMRLLNFIGIRPMCDWQDTCICLKLLTCLYTMLVVVILIVGYILQYMACFRRERGFCYLTRSGKESLTREIDDVYDTSCYGSMVFSSLLPSLLHLVAYLHMVFVFRSTDDEHLPILMERVFVISTNLSTGFMSQKKLVKMLWMFVIFSLIWMSMSFFAVFYMMSNGDIHFKWMGTSSQPLVMFTKILLVSCTLGHDIVQGTIISNYCLQAQLLTSYVQFLREKILQFPIIPLEWMRDIEDFKKVLNHFNYNIAPSVCLLIMVNASFAVSGILWILGFDNVDTETLPIYGLSILNVILWILMASAPFVQAARLSNACEVLKTVGQEARTRPYVHQDTPTSELDSILLYTSSLQISAELFYLPITGRKLCFCLTVSAIVLLILGQCHYLIPT